MKHPAPRKSAVRAQIGFAGSTLAYVVMALACLRQGGTAHPWSRLDIFSGGFLGLLLLSARVGLTFGRRLLDDSGGGLRQAAGIAYDRVTLIIAPALAAGDALIFLDYGHWHLVPGLARAPLQVLGLALGAAAMAWTARTDVQLIQHFEDPGLAETLMTTGPFRYVRHPRYAVIAGVRAAYALTFASILGWVLAATWMAVLVRRIRLEEAHLRAQFGDSYDRYAARTPRLIPGLY